MCFNFCALTFYVFTGLATALTSAVENPGDDPLQWLRDSIPGEPNVDYPIFSAVEQTSFSCDDKVFGGKHTLSPNFFTPIKPPPRGAFPPLEPPRHSPYTPSLNATPTKTPIFE